MAHFENNLRFYKFKKHFSVVFIKLLRWYLYPKIEVQDWEFKSFSECLVLLKGNTDVIIAVSA